MQILLRINPRIMNVPIRIFPISNQSIKGFQVFQGQNVSLFFISSQISFNNSLQKIPFFVTKIEQFFFHFLFLEILIKLPTPMVCKVKSFVNSYKKCFPPTKVSHYGSLNNFFPNRTNKNLEDRPDLKSKMKAVGRKKLLNDGRHFEILI